MKRASIDECTGYFGNPQGEMNSEWKVRESFIEEVVFEWYL